MSYKFKKILALAIGLMLLTQTAIAGELTIENRSAHNIVCYLQHYPAAIKILPQHSFSSRALMLHQTGINWVRCAGLKANNIDLTPQSSDRWFIYNGQAKTVFNVLLYPYIPTYPVNNFGPMLKRITEEFQNQHPEVLLNVVISNTPQLNSYEFKNLDSLLGRQGYDMVELDTMLLGVTVERQLITPIKINNSSAHEFWPAALNAVKYKNLTYAIPSRVCEYFLFSHKKKDTDFKSLTDLINYLAHLSKDRAGLLSDFNGNWNLISNYLQSYASNHGIQALNNIVQQSPDIVSINSLKKLIQQCQFLNINQCSNNYYHAGLFARLEKDFAQHKAHTYLGFSEAGFYLNLYAPKEKLYALSIPYGKRKQPLIYTDAYVRNAITCVNKICANNFNYFADYMNQTATQFWINYSLDLGSHLPPRYLLSAVKRFYLLPTIKTNSLYHSFRANLNVADSYPNNLTPDEVQSLYHELSAKLKM